MKLTPKSVSHLNMEAIQYPFNYLTFLAGICILVVVLIDVFKMVLYINGGGRLSTVVASFLWNMFYKLGKRDGKSEILNYAGGFILLFLVLLWIFLIWCGYSLIYVSDINSVIVDETQQPAAIIDKIYFVGYTLTSLGNGGYSPGSDWWKIISNLMGLNTMVFISLGISYLLPVLQAVIDKRTLAVYIHTMGSTPLEIITRGYNGNNFNTLYPRFGNIENLLIKHAERHLAYPILHYFHTNRKAHSLPLNLAVLDEAMTIQEIYKIDKSENAHHWVILRGALDNFYRRLDDRFLVSEDIPPPFDYGEELPKNLVGHDIEDPARALQKFQAHRCRILGYIMKKGWTWKDVITPSQNS